MIRNFFGEVLHEVYSSISRHKLRTILTGFGVAWAMFILFLLLGAGNGFRSGLLSVFSGYASNSIWLHGGIVRRPVEKGLHQGERVYFKQELLNKLNIAFDEIKYISPEIEISSSHQVEYKDYIARYNVKGIGQNYFNIKTLNVSSGRCFNKRDFTNKRRVLVIGGRVKDALFGEETAIGKYIEIGNVFFQVIGIIEKGSVFSEIEQDNIYAPDNVIKDIFSVNNEFYSFGALLDKRTNINTFERKIRKFISSEIGFHTKDKRALYINNVQLQIRSFNTLFDGMDLFLWCVGICILITAMIGIGNIMVVTVNERKQEIGIRKAIGATPFSILILIMSESILITISFGLFGILTGYGGLILYNKIIVTLQDSGQQIFSKAYIDSWILVTALIIMTISGLISGIYPARKAAKIIPIKTINTPV